MKWNYNTPGIPEVMFVKGDVPITKTEVRVLSLARLMLGEDHSVLDIGCGTGSVTVEAALICKRGKVVAIDRNEEAVSLTRQNIEMFEVSNAEVIMGTAPDNLPRMEFDRIFVGGSGGDMEGIVEYSANSLKADGIIVINTILLESTYKALTALENNRFTDITCTCLNVSRGHKASGWMMKALNPIYVISARKITI